MSGVRSDTGRVVIQALRDLRLSWRTLARADIAWKAVAFALLTPVTTLVIRWAMFAGGNRAIADTDIATFFLTTPVGVATLLAGGAVIGAVTALEIACLIAIGSAAARGSQLDVREALIFGASRASQVLRLTANMVVRLLVGLAPFALAAGLAYWALLREHDINYYLAQRPPAFWTAAVIAGAIVSIMALVLVRTAARWALSLPLVLFENVSPRRALGESARRSTGERRVIVGALASWAAVALVLQGSATVLPQAIGRVLGPLVPESMAPLLVFIMALAIVWAVLGLVASIVSMSLFALVVGRLYMGFGNPSAPRIPEARETGTTQRRFLLPRPVRLSIAAIAVLAVIGFSLVFVVGARDVHPVQVIGHRGSSAGPENTLAAFRLAAEQGADFIELDVQESADGEVLVVHDGDLMKVGGSPLKIWEASAAQIRAVDIGSRAGAQFSGERVPTLAEALAACKGRARVIVELKSYGHNQNLEEKVVAIVEASGMADDTIFMSLDHAMVRRMKQLRPAWRAGVLVAKAIGDLTKLGGDFLAVESGLATRSLVRHAHRSGQDVYVWTVNDPARMISAMSAGVDGLITDKPEVAREVVARRAAMTDVQRILLALLVRLGASDEALVAQDSLRP